MACSASSSKTVRIGDPGAEEQLLKWFNEVDSDYSDTENCEENHAILSEHESDSEIEEGREVESDEQNERGDQRNKESDSESDGKCDDENKENKEQAGEASRKENNYSNEDDSNRSKIQRRYFYGKNRFKWSTQPAISNRGRRLQENIVVKLPGLRPIAQLGNKADPITVWKLLFTDELCDIILKWTNKRIAIQRTKYLRKTSPTLKDLDKNELQAFFGLLAFTSLFKSNNKCINTLFATDGTGREIIRCIMSKERFAFLLVCLRFDNPEDRAGRRLTDPAAPITDIFELFVKNCQVSYVLGTSVCIDEMLIGFRGRCIFKMYLPSKPVKYGLKIMCCTDARTGYFFNGYIYAGKNSDGKHLPAEDRKLSKPTQSVLRLTQPIYYTNRNITFDNWFTSLELVKILKERGLTCIGTLRKNKREIPPEFKPNKKREVGSALYGFTRDVAMLSYVTKKNKAVILLSSSHHHESNDPVTKKPDIIMDYNCTKGGVDALDEKCAKFSCSHRTSRWPMAIFYQLLDISTVNAYIMYESYKDNEHMERSAFLKKLAFQLVTPELQRRLAIPNLPRNLKQTIAGIVDNPETTPKQKLEKIEKRKNCSLCPYKLKRRTAYLCFECQNPICLECAKKMCPDCAAN